MERHEPEQEDQDNGLLEPTGLLLPPFPWGAPASSGLPRLTGRRGTGFGAADLLWLRLDRGLTYDQAGAAVGVSGAQCLRWEQGQDAQLFFRCWPMLCQAFGESPGEQDPA